MEMTFLTMHDLTPQATVLFASASIDDVLGYDPEEVIGKSCFDYFHPEELPFARDIHGESIHFDNAAVLYYCRIRNKQGEWVKCECVFTVVYDVFIAATTRYKGDRRTNNRAQAAGTFQRTFERPGPLDPRYQMIDHLAPKFRSTSLARTAIHEPRAAFLLNRFSQNLPILYATHAAQLVLSCDPNEAVGRSFYEYIDEQYLVGTVSTIERAKENDSIAYLRLLWKVWLSMDDLIAHEEEEEEEEEEMEDEEQESPPSDPEARQHRLEQRLLERYEVECLISASSDGLIAVVRRAPPIDGIPPGVRPPGIFACPWATSPLPPYTVTPPTVSPAASRPSTASTEVQVVPLDIPAIPAPTNQDVMNSIRDNTVFAWSISSLNDDVSNDNASMVNEFFYDDEEENE